ncbi:Fic family protein [Aquabacterium fontiphilum]|uniref:Fic family protein n=1 Tax=Aquabacterium fontiphilum TaxID=450365 RepID=UPI001F1628C4|nr:Fic family protein [Aquabacterium fontiphilum]
MRLTNQRVAELGPLVHAAVVSFAFVFIHPFMDGNGRLSRYLIHHCLGQSGRLPPQFLLPISVAMKKHEADYLRALTTFSKPARQLCQVTWGGDEHYTYEWAPEADTWFRCMDLRGSDLANLIVTIFQNGGTLSNNRRKRYAERVQDHVLDAIEEAVSRAMQGQPLSEDGED